MLVRLTVRSWKDPKCRPTKLRLRSFKASLQKLHRDLPGVVDEILTNPEVTDYVDLVYLLSEEMGENQKKWFRGKHWDVQWLAQDLFGLCLYEEVEDMVCAAQGESNG